MGGVEFEKILGGEKRWSVCALFSYPNKNDCMLVGLGSGLLRICKGEDLNLSEGKLEQDGEVKMVCCENLEKSLGGVMETWY